VEKGKGWKSNMGERGGDKYIKWIKEKEMIFLKIFHRSCTSTKHYIVP
jgi:hypothetical protein